MCKSRPTVPGKCSLCLFPAYQDVRAANLAALKADIAQGIADISVGRIREIDIELIKRRGRATLATRESAT